MHQAEPVHDRFLGDYLFHESPAQLLIVGKVSETLLDAPPEGVKVLRFSALSDAVALTMTPHETTQFGHHVLVLQVDAKHPELAVRLGRAIRAFPHRIFLHCHTPPDMSPPKNETFYAFGFRALPVMRDEDLESGHTHWYEYSLSSYKSAPDWLNARFWANPERFEMVENSDEYDDESDDEDE